jgi:hypothetical protein
MTKKLPRRKFLLSGVLSISAFTVHQAFSKNYVVSDVKEELKFFDRITRKTYSLEKLSDPKLFSFYQSSLISWQKSGYEATSNSYYTCMDDGLALFPLQLLHQSLGVLDTVMICFKKDENGDWIQLNSLSGLDLNALAVAADALQNSNEQIDLEAYLLPIKSIRGDGHRFETKKGIVSLKTLLSENGLSTEVIVWKNETVLCHKSIGYLQKINV